MKRDIRPLDIFMKSENNTHKESEEVLLRAAQHRIRNDLQTIFSLIRLSERRLGPHALGTEEILHWLNAFASVYDALPIWDQNRSVSVRQLMLSVRERIPMGDVMVTEDNGAEVPGASGVAMTLAVSGLLLYARANARENSTLRVRVLSPDQQIRVECEFLPNQSCCVNDLPFTLRIPVEALRGTCELVDAADGKVAFLVVPCR